MPIILLGAMSWMFLATFLPAAENEIAVDSAESRSAGAVYARHLEYTINLIVDEYVRPVSRTDLMVAALSGLYEAAKVPVPSSLRADIEAAKSDSARVALLTDARPNRAYLEPLPGIPAPLARI